MKNSKKTIAVFFLTILMLMSLSGCGKRGACEECGQTEKLNKFVEKDGDIHWYCDTCYNMAKLFAG